MSPDDEATVTPAMPTPAPGPSADGTWTVERSVDYETESDWLGPQVCDVYWRVCPPEGDREHEQWCLPTEAEARAVADALNGLSRSNKGQALDLPRPEEVGTLPVTMTWERTKMVWESLRDLLWLTDRFRNTIWSERDGLILRCARMRLTGTQFPEALGYYRPVPAARDGERRVS